MKNVLVPILLLMALSAPSHAGFKYFGKNGQYVNATETDQERAERMNREEAYKGESNKLEKSIADMNAKPPVVEMRAAQEEKPAEQEVIYQAAPGGHRRHELERQNSALRKEVRALETRHIRDSQRLQEQQYLLRTMKK